MEFPSGKERVVLNLLRDRQGGAYGLELVEASGGQLRRGSIYVTLARMVGKNFVKVTKPEKDKSQAGLPRPIYEITALGERALQAAELMQGELAPRLTLREA